MDDANTPLGPIISLVLAHCPRAIRPAWQWLWLFENRINEGAERTNEPMLAQMRIAWWRDRISDDTQWAAQRDPMILDMAQLALHCSDLPKAACHLLNAIEARVTAQNAEQWAEGLMQAGAAKARFYALLLKHPDDEVLMSVGRAFACAESLRGGLVLQGVDETNHLQSHGKQALIRVGKAKIPRPFSLMRLYAQQVLSNPNAPPRRRDGLRLLFHGLTGL